MIDEPGFFKTDKPVTLFDVLLADGIRTDVLTFVGKRSPWTTKAVADP